MFSSNTLSEHYKNVGVTAVSSSGGTISKLILNGIEIAKNSGSNWTYSAASSVITIKEYLATLDTGSWLFTAVFNHDESFEFIIDITDGALPLSSGSQAKM